MRRTNGLLLAAVLGGLAGCQRAEPDPGPPPVAWSAGMQAVADGNNRFAFDLCGKLREADGNLFFSPFSAHTALAMTATGAKGDTRDQMVKVLHLPADETQALAAGDLGRYYAHPRQDYQLSVANAVWGQTRFPWRAEFLAVQKERFGAGFREADFAKDPEAERQRINQWVEEQTREKIKDLIPAGFLTPMHRMVLANAIYFKGAWAEPFDPKATRDGPFHLADGTQVQAPLMHRKGGFRRYVAASKEDRWKPEFQVAELPYRGGELSMVVLLPGAPDGLPALEAKLSADTLTRWLADAHDAHGADLVLPKFRIETGTVNFKEPLQTLGMTAAFSDTAADFSGMHTGGEQLVISHVLQKAFVDVNEEGTEAAAATAVLMKTVSATLDFRADHPFLFLIRDTKRGTILFMGRVTNPKG